MLMTATFVAAMMPHASTSSDYAGSVQHGGDTEVSTIAPMLAFLTSDGNVRLMEALAVVIARSDWGRICAAAATPAAEQSMTTPRAAAILSAAERIARRAIAGTIGDPINGATRFHRLGQLPDWARGAEPVADVGDFLFYRL